MNINHLLTVCFSPLSLLRQSSSENSAQSKTTHDSPIRSDIFTREQLTEHAKLLAKQHQVKLSRFGGFNLFARFEDNRSVIDKAYFSFARAAGDKEALTPGAEWILDNYHVIEEHVREVRQHLPRAYYRTLPKLISEAFEGYPRVYHLAHELIAHTDAVVDGDVSAVMVRAYQTETILSIGELWAIPIMLRLALIENLRRLAVANLQVKEERERADGLVEELLGDGSRTGTDVLLELATIAKNRPELISASSVHIIRRLRGKGLKTALTLQWLEERLREKGLDPEELIRHEHQSYAANQISIGNTVTSLKLVSSLNWRAWFESLSHVDSILAQDPLGVYLQSDFITRDRCRHKLEILARSADLSEGDVARKVVELANNAGSDYSEDQNIDQERYENDQRIKHVGYYLLDDGLSQLEPEVGYAPSIFVALWRWSKQHAFFFYISAICLLTFVLVEYLVHYAALNNPLLGLLLVTALVGVIPASHLASDLLQWIVSHLTTPTVLPKLDFDAAVPKEHRTLVTVHALFNDKEAIARFVEQIEVRYLGNEDENIFFSILADLPDADHESLPSDRPLVQYAERLISDLNARYFPDGSKKFFLLFRKRLWNSSEQKFMGWERKRGKVMELNRLLQGDVNTTFTLNIVDPEIFSSIRYVITLDGDSQLPRGSARRLIGTLAHPLNRPLFDKQKCIVYKGYAIIQPRVGVSLTSANVSHFSRIFSGHAGLDPYTNTVSDVYQDLFGEGSYLGKAIYDVRAFERALENRVPENSLLSHDLFEGLFARVALATDIELIDEFPSRLNVYAKRQHRWVRGDWQLLPWMFWSVPNAKREKYKSPISALGTWKLVDNLRRSLLAPSCFLLFCLSWLIMPGSPLFWNLLVVLIIAFPVYANLANALVIPPLGLMMSIYVRGLSRDLAKHSLQALLSISFLPHLALLMLHAIAVSLGRIFITKRHLLEWETAYLSERRLGVTLKAFMAEMAPAVLTCVFLSALILIYRPQNIAYALPFILLWFCSPLLAFWVSRPLSATAPKLSTRQQDYLRRIAWDTWRFFEQLADERHNHLVPDNVQLVPSRIIAERSSPTNIGLGILSTISAYDLGFLPLTTVLNRLNKTYITLGKLEKFHGHYLNWYQIVSLQPLYPRYVSAVDSGNFVASIMAAQAALQKFMHEPILDRAHWQHSAFVMDELSKLFSNLDQTALQRIEQLRKETQNVPEGLRALSGILAKTASLAESLEKFRKTALQDLEPERQRYFESLYYELCEAANCQKLFAWYQDVLTLTEQLSEMHGSKVAFDLSASLRSVQRILEGRPLTLSLLAKVQRRLRYVVERFSEDAINRDLPAMARELVQRIAHSLSTSEDLVKDYFGQLEFVVRFSEEIVRDADFSFLYDNRKNLFVIGYNVDEARRDTSYYDLLASECRTTSLIAIANGQIPEKHWFSLGRALTDSSGGKALLSWSGTMFEYLMPLLLIKDFPGTILSETSKSVVRAQRAYGAKRGVPWGVSESGYSGVDFEKTYQYHAFGVPGLGFKRGLSEDLVISPYSTFLALMVDAENSLKNIAGLEKRGMRGEYGFFEAIDFTHERLSSEEEYVIVRSFLAHHQGMSLLSIDNLLNEGVFQERFHSIPSIKATELYLHERFPHRVPAIVPHQAELSMLEAQNQDARVSRGETLTSPHTKYPRIRLLSNGRYSVVVDNAGSGWSFMDKDTALTRWREDLCRNDYGYYVFARDLDSQKLWSAAYQPTRVEPEFYEVIFNPDKVEFKRRDFGISLHTEITISPEDNVEVRKVTVRNLSSRRRVIELTTYGEVVLTRSKADAAHPAFAKMFVESEFVPEFDALLFARRPRSIREEKLYLLHMVSMNVVWAKTEFESSRSEFLGRGGSIHNPAAFTQGTALSRQVGAVLDPVFSLRVRLEIEPGGSEQASFILATSNNKDDLLRLARRYHEYQSVNRAFEMAWSQSNVELRNEQITIAQTHSFQRLAGAILFNVTGLRGEADVIERNRLSQSGFWRFGISGDFPIVLARVSDPAQIKLVQELILAHWYLRLRGLSFDLVIINEYPGGYLQNFQEELEALVRHGYAAGFAEKNGGVFLRNLTQLSEQDLILLQAVARVVVNGTKGTLSQQVEIEDEMLPAIPTHKAFFSYIREEQFPAFEPPRYSLEFDNSYGGFSEDGKVYTIVVRNGVFPPLPWCNVVSNPNFGFMVSEAGGGYTWSENSRENRLTPWSNDPVSDPVGEAVYLRDVDSGHYWSATPRPVPGGEPYVIRHGFGYSEFDTQVKGIFSRLTISGALEDKVKWWNLAVVNGDFQAREIEIFLYLEWVLGILREDGSRQLVTDFDAVSQVLFAVNHYNNEFAGRYVIVGSDSEIKGYTSKREEFLGRNRDPSSPLALETAAATSLANLISTNKNYVKLSSKTGAGFDSCAVLSVRVTLEPGERKEVLFYMAECDSVEQRRSNATKFRSAQRCAGELERVREDWGALTSAVQVSTPERSFDILLNGWLLYQSLSCRVFGRSAFYQSGGALGFRDQLQDVMAMLVARPSLARRQILLHAARQFVEGDVQHWWHPPTGRGVRTRISDDYLWLPYVVLKYLEVTGDFGILDEEVGYIEGQHLEHGHLEAYIVPSVSSRRGSIYEHCVIAIDLGLKFGVHGLPLIGCGDWNDGMNEVGHEGKGESVWLGWFLYDVLTRFSGIVAERRDNYRANEYAGKAKQILSAIEQHAWDGSWYKRAFFDDGTPLGSSVNEECKIDSLSQSWAVITGAGDKNRVVPAMESVYRELVDDENGLIRLLTPPFQGDKLKPGYIAGYLPGIRENGAQYTHAAVWVIMATSILGRGTQAFKLFNMINPVNHSRSKEAIQRYQGEPYVTCGDVYSVDPYAGRAGWSWYTGSASWLYTVGVEYILGLKVRADHFYLDPCIPKDWKNFKIRLNIKGKVYEISVDNSAGVEKGVRRVAVNGIEAVDRKISLKPEDQSGDARVEILVEMGLN